MGPEIKTDKISPTAFLPAGDHHGRPPRARAVWTLSQGPKRMLSLELRDWYEARKDHAIGDASLGSDPGLKSRITTD